MGASLGVGCLRSLLFSAVVARNHVFLDLSGFAVIRKYWSFGVVNPDRALLCTQYEAAHYCIDIQYIRIRNTSCAMRLAQCLYIILPRFCTRASNFRPAIRMPSVLLRGSTVLLHDENDHVQSAKKDILIDGNIIRRSGAILFLGPMTRK
jgi:hypothetical protein